MKHDRQGLSIVEFFFAALIVGMVLIPLYDLFVGSYRSVFRSRLSYMARHVAREILQELRQVPFDSLEGLSHDWTPVGGHVLGRSDTTATKLAFDEDRSDPALVYPKEYGRIETKLSIMSLTDPTSGVSSNSLKKAVLDVRWSEGGKAKVHRKEILEQFEQIIGRHMH